MQRIKNGQKFRYRIIDYKSKQNKIIGSIVRSVGLEWGSKGSRVQILFWLFLKQTIQHHMHFITEKPNLKKLHRLHHPDQLLIG